MVTRTLLTLALWLGACTASFAQQSSSAHVGTGWRLVFLGPQQAVLIEARVQSDKGPATRRRKLAELLLARFDADKDSQLSATEATQLPQGAKASGPPLGDAWKQADLAPADERLSIDELTEFVNRQLGAAFQVTSRPPRLAQSVQLVDRIDADHDAQISVNELQGAMTSLRRTDLDDDEAVSVGELQPFPRQAGQRPPDAAVQESPLLPIDQDSEIQTAAARIVKAYALGRQTVPLAVAAADAAIDTDQNRQLTAGELTTWLKTGSPAYTVTAKLGRPSSVLVQADDVQPQTGSKVSITLGGAAVDITARNNEAEQGDSSRMYGIRFLMNDRDKNGYLDEMEFAGLQLPAAFKDVDVNGDGMLFRDELSNFVAFDAIAIQSRIELMIADEGKTLFELLDSNVDRRLTPREVHEGFGRLAAVDRNQDQRVAQSELESRYQLTFSFGRNQIFAPSAPGMNTPVTARLRNQNEGPPWFRRMDRNQDGDITWREFLGTRDQFTTLDTSGDGLINRSEAEEGELPPAPTESTSDVR